MFCFADATGETLASVLRAGNAGANDIADHLTVLELGYKTATPWPIYDRKGGSTIMFHMIHATDHDRAPSLMRSAYTWAVAPKALESEEQLSLKLGDIEF